MAENMANYVETGLHIIPSYTTDGRFSKSLGYPEGGKGLENRASRCRLLG